MGYQRVVVNEMVRVVEGLQKILRKDELMISEGAFKKRMCVEWGRMRVCETHDVKRAQT
jgi:hypothetical protein